MPTPPRVSGPELVVPEQVVPDLVVAEPAESAGPEPDPMLALDEAGFASLVEGSRRGLQVHCYRMLGSFEDAEDLVQETFLRAWRKRDSFEGRSSVRTWLYRIATNACLDFLERNPRQPTRPQPIATGAPGAGVVDASAPDELAWLRPYPDRWLDPVSDDSEPEAAVVAKETIELAYIIAIQYLPPKQRAVLILSDVLDWPAAQIAALLEVSTASVNSALQRGRATLKQRLPPRRLEWAPSSDPSVAERALLQRYLDATAKADTSAMAELLREDVRVNMPPFWIVGRANLMAWMNQVFDQNSPMFQGEWRSVATRANRQPAIAHYVRRPDATEFLPAVMDVLALQDGLVVEIFSFGPEVFHTFGLAPSL